jgi:ABC-type multidrug transport system ATPase subunit
MKEDNAIQVSSVTRKFDQLIAVDDLSFTVLPGEIFGLLGPNGAGKTTLINLILGLLKPHQGSLKVLGFDVSTQIRKIYRQVGYVPQETNLYLDLSAEDNLWHHAALHCPDLSVVKDRMHKLLDFTNLWERRKDPVHTYSGGMKRRLALARALLHDPLIIFFDEPTLGVDVQGRFALWEHIQNQRQTGKTFVISTNNMVEADTLCDRVLILDHGKKISLDTPERLKSGMKNDLVTIRTDTEIFSPEKLLAKHSVRNITRLQPGLLRFEMANASSSTSSLIHDINQDYKLESILIAQPSLDDVFLHFTGRALRE